MAYPYIKKDRKKSGNKESKLQTLVSKYLRSAYPESEFIYDTGSGSKRSEFMGALMKSWRSGSGFPDMTLYERRGEWSLLMIELKAEKAPLEKTDGTLRKNEHLENQQAMHIKLRNKGYYACFGKGFDHCRSLIDWYMSGCVGEPPKYIKKNLPKLF